MATHATTNGSHNLGRGAATGASAERRRASAERCGAAVAAWVTAGARGSAAVLAAAVAALVERRADGLVRARLDLDVAREGMVEGEDHEQDEAEQSGDGSDHHVL